MEVETLTGDIQVMLHSPSLELLHFSRNRVLLQKSTDPTKLVIMSSWTHQRSVDIRSYNWTKGGGRMQIIEVQEKLFICGSDRRTLKLLDTATRST